MAYNVELDLKIQAEAERDGMQKKKMFGGTCYLMDSKMVCGVWKDFMILRLGGHEAQAALDRGDGRVFDVTGRPMKGWIMVPAEGLDAKSIRRWMDKAKSFVATVQK